MTPELRHGLYSVNPKDIGEESYERDAQNDVNKEKARSVRMRSNMFFAQVWNRGVGDVGVDGSYNQRGFQVIRSGGAVSMGTC